MAVFGLHVYQVPLTDELVTKKERKLALLTHTL